MYIGVRRREQDGVWGFRGLGFGVRGLEFGV